jgi:hypothetical protein
MMTFILGAAVSLLVQWSKQRSASQLKMLLILLAITSARPASTGIGGISDTDGWQPAR